MRLLVLLALFFCGVTAQFLPDLGLFYPGVVEDEANFQYEYDFVIIGAGSGGSVVANRLSENQDWTVLLLEAGSDETYLTDIPLMAALQSSSSFDWGYKTEKMTTACLGLKDGRCKVPRGKGIGGTSLINFLLYTRGNRMDYDGWERLGNPGWGYRDVLKYFKKSEDCLKCQFIDPDYHGFGGYLKIEHPHVQSPLLKRFLKAGLELGYKNTDVNGRYSVGFSEVQATMSNGRRCSANKAFLKPIRSRPNLQVTPRARVTRILINPQTKQAYAVEVIKNKEKYVIRAKREIIVSAGSINSPHILMNSGVGPKEHLDEMNITTIQDLSVGFNLQDHVSSSTLTFLVNQSITVTDVGVQNPRDFINYAINGEGPYTIPGGSLGYAFLKTKYSMETEDYPDVELVLGAGALNGDVYGTLRAVFGIPDEVNEKVYMPIRHIPAFSIASVLLRPKSRGRIVLKDNNPLHWPRIVPNYLEHEDDVNVLIEGMKMAIKVSRTRAFADVNTTLYSKKFPGCEHEFVHSDSYHRCVVKLYASTLGHHAGTCKMGPDDDPNAVVDSRLRVRGVGSLRVVDASIMPNVVAGHTNAVVMMIGEKASDMIKEDWS